MLDLNNPSLQFALQAVARASELVHQVESELAEPALTKSDRSPVTVADFAAQALVASLLEESFPNDVLVAEEHSQALHKPEADSLRQQVGAYVQRFVPGVSLTQVEAWIDRGGGDPEGRYWVLDPVDGTKGFLRGGQYVVALALIEAGQVQIGVLGCPHLEAGGTEARGGAGSLVAAQRGRGAWACGLYTSPERQRFTPADFQPLRVSPQDQASQACLLRSFEAAHTNTEVIDTLMERLAIQAEPLRLDSQAKYALLAAGRGEIMIRLPPEENPGYKEKTWDQAAGSLVVEEAGGKISDLDGKPLDFTAGRTLARNRGVLATNGLLHSLILETLAALTR